MHVHYDEMVSRGAEASATMRRGCGCSSCLSVPVPSSLHIGSDLGDIGSRAGSRAAATQL
jgi:hypothetical protein